MAPAQKTGVGVPASKNNPQQASHTMVGPKPFVRGVGTGKINQTSV